MNKLVVFFASIGLMLAAGFSAHSQSSGGYPSRPRLQSATVVGSGAAPALNVLANGATINGVTTLNSGGVSGELLLGAANGTIEFSPFGSGAAVQSAYQWFQDNNAYLDAPATGTPAGGSVFIRGLGSNVGVHICPDGSFSSNITLSCEGIGSVNSAAYFLNNIQVARTAYAACNGSTGAQLATIQSSGMTCSRVGTGFYSVGFSPAFNTLAPVCTLTAYGIPGGAVNFGITLSINFANLSGATFQASSNTTGTPAIDTNILIVCVGT